MHVAAATPRPRRFQPGSREIIRKRFHWEGLKHQLTFPAIFGLLILSLILMFSPYIVVFFIEGDERAIIQEVANNPSAMGALLFLIVCKMTGLGLIFSCLPLISKWSILDADGPAPPPPHVVQKKRLLTPTQKTLLTNGQVLLGEVTAINWPRVQIHYIDTAGHHHTQTLRAHRTQNMERPRLGDALILLHDPISPSRVVAPSLLDITFEPGQLAPDKRAPLPTSRRIHHECILPTPKTLTLFSTLHPLDQPWWNKIQTRRHPHTEVGHIGELILGPGAALQLHNPNHPPILLRLDRPFVVDISVWLTSEQTAELNLTLRPQGAPPGASTIQLRTELPQQNLSPALPLKQEQHPYLDPHQFALLWDMICFHANLHGLELQGLLEPTVETTDRTVPQTAAA